MSVLIAMFLALSAEREQRVLCVKTTKTKKGSEKHE